MRTCSCCSGTKTIKRGLWSPDEDQKLKAYVSNHDFKVWSQVPVQAGLDRCGKSCRLRWLNYLRPDIKRGEFSAQEQMLIFELQAAYGNRWSWIAKWIPGRTDNEIKNFWHVHKKNYKKKRQQKSGISSKYRLAAPLKIDTCVSKLEEPKSEEDGPLQLQPESICAAMNNSGCSSSSVDSESNIGNMNHFMSEFHISEDELQEFLNWVGP